MNESQCVTALHKYTTEMKLILNSSKGLKADTFHALLFMEFLSIPCLIKQTQAERITAEKHPPLGTLHCFE